MMGLSYAVHAYAWTGHWSNDTLHLADHAKELGFDILEVPLMEIEGVDPDAIAKRADSVGIGLCTSTACSREQDIAMPDEEVRRRGIDYLKQCVAKTADMGATVFTGVIYSAIGGKLEAMPDQGYYNRSAEALREVAQYAAERNVSLGIEPVNRYETYLINSAEQAAALADSIGLPNVGVHLDAYHMNIEENEFYAPTKAVAEKLVHYHLSESHRGIPGTGTVDWEQIYRALSESDYRGVVGLESFIEVSDAMRDATCVWRALADSSDQLLTEGLAFVKGLEREYYGG